MKVLQINATYGYGSTGLIVRDIGEALKQQGHTPYFAYQSCLVPPENGVAVGSLLDRKTHALLTRLTGKQAYFSHRATRRLLRHVDKISPDVVHLHNLHSNYIHLNLLLDYLAKKDIPTVITLHDCWYFTGKCFHYVDVDCDGFTHGCGNCPKKNAAPQSLFFDPSRKVLRDRDLHFHSIPRLAAVGCSEWITEEAKKGILGDCNLYTVRNGVDTAVFYPREKTPLKERHGLSGKRVILGMSNKWLSKENLPVFHRVAAGLDDATVLLLVGTKAEEEALLSPYGEKVRSFSYVKGREALAELYALSDVFVNLTHADTLPTVNMESIASGTPVVTYDSCGSPELVPPECGIIVPEGDVDALISAIGTALATDFPRCAAIGKAVYDKDIAYTAYLNIYETLRKQG